MAFEVELKAWVRKAEALKRSLDTKEGLLYVGFEEKEDTYYALEELPLLRIRKEVVNEERSLVVTHKKRSTIDGIEENLEYEFSVDPRQEQAVHAFFTALGYRVAKRKFKRGWRYRQVHTTTTPGLTVELVHLEGLGWFIEVEALVNTREERRQAREELMAFLASLGIDSSAIESKPYLQLIG
ncbi:MAG: class IV adenylate cyclase [Sphaerochaeta sp.]|jgi:predicted adenylyl cyclase CyaB|nr:MAG: class IV adenylate cyclase [Sphaerochaeta sp.]